MKRLIRYFLQGLLYVIPLAVTLYVLYKIFVVIDGFLGLKIPGIGFVITLVSITLIGFLATNVLTKRLLSFIDVLFEKMPFIKLIYSSIKDLIGAFVGDKKSFDKPVLVKLNEDGSLKVIGFITRESMDAFGLTDHVAVYLPQSYNFAGNLIVVPVERVEKLQADSSDAMAFLISGGVSGK